MIRTAWTALIFSVNHKHAVLTSQRSHQCLDALRTAEKPTMCDMDRAFFFLPHVCSEARGEKIAKATWAPPSLGAGRDSSLLWAHNQGSAGMNTPTITQRNLCEGCILWHCVSLGDL